MPNVSPDSFGGALDDRLAAQRAGADFTGAAFHTRIGYCLLAFVADPRRDPPPLDALVTVDVTRGDPRAANGANVSDAAFGLRMDG